MEQLALLPFVTPLWKIACWINNLKWCEAKVYLFICSSFFSYVFDLCCHLQIIYFLFDNFYGFFISFLSLFVSSLKSLAVRLSLFWLCHKIPGPHFYFSHFTYLSNTNTKRKYAYLKGKKLNIMITSSEVCVF